jgi:hypothetical protein
MAYTYNGKIIRAGRSWQDDNNITHPATWMRWSDEYKVTMGLVWEDDPAPFDNRFYWGRQADGTLIERSLDDVTDDDGNVTDGLKTIWKQRTKETAASLLAPTDWQVIKATEVADYSVPSAVTTYRAAVRTASNTIEAAIDAASDITAFMALWDAPVDADGNPTGNAPINNWPDEV